MRKKKQVVHKEKKKKQDSIHIIIFILAIGVFLYSGCKLFLIFSEYQKGEQEYESVMDTVVIEHSRESNGSDNSEDEAPVQFRVDFESLQRINPEAVAWIRFDEPAKISYPVVQGPDNSKYLKTTFEGKQNPAGTLFVDVDNAGDFSDKNTFIYGHNMKNGSMFGQLRKYKNASFCKENPYFYIYTPDEEETRYQIFSVCIVEDTSASYDKFYENEDEYLQYLDYIRGLARYDVSVKLTAESQIVSLSTCTNVRETQRLLVHGVKVSETDEMLEE